MKKEAIIPIEKRCVCGKSVDNHHFYCDKCYSDRQLLKNKIAKLTIKWAPAKRKWYIHPNPLAWPEVIT